MAKSSKSLYLEGHKTVDWHFAELPRPEPILMNQFGRGPTDIVQLWRFDYLNSAALNLVRIDSIKFGGSVIYLAAVNVAAKRVPNRATMSSDFIAATSAGQFQVET